MSDRWTFEDNTKSGKGFCRILLDNMCRGASLALNYFLGRSHLEQKNQIIDDLMGKIADDITRAMIRTLMLTPHPRLPVAMSGGAAAVGVLAGVLEQGTGEYDTAKRPDNETVMLAALLCAHVAIDPNDGVASAYRDFEILKSRASLSSAQRVT